MSVSSHTVGDVPIVRQRLQSVARKSATGHQASPAWRDRETHAPLGAAPGAERHAPTATTAPLAPPAPTGPGRAGRRASQVGEGVPSREARFPARASPGPACAGASPP